MELKDYLTALRRYWLTWLAVTALAVGLAATTLALATSTYEATARVFIAGSPSIPNSASFVNQRAKSYPDVAESQAVLGPVIRGLGLDTTPTALRARVSATNPVDTSQIRVSVTGTDPAETAAIANAVAEQLTTVVEDLETPASGERPVRLTLTDPAEAPTSPVSPVPAYVLGLGLVIGLLLGAAAALTRGRLDTRLYDEVDVRHAWGDDEPVDVLVPRHGRRSRGALTGTPARALAHRLELVSDQEPIRVVLLSVAPRELGLARSFADELVGELRSRGMTAAVSGLPNATPAAVAGTGRVRIDIVTPLTPLRFWRHVAARHEEVVPLVTPAQVDAAELREVRTLLETASIAPLALVLTPPAKRSPARLGRSLPPRRRTADDAGLAPLIDALTAEVPPPSARAGESDASGAPAPASAPPSALQAAERARPVVTARVGAEPAARQEDDDRGAPTPPQAENHLPKRKRTSGQRHPR